MSRKADKFVSDIYSLWWHRPTSFVHRYYPMGIDSIYYGKVRSDVEQLATRLAEPVSLAFHSDYLKNSKPDENSNIVQVYVPATAAVPGYGWLPAYAISPNRFFTNRDLRSSILLSGAPADSPYVHFVEIGTGKSVMAAKKHLAALFKRAGIDVFAEGNGGEIISGAIEARKPHSSHEFPSRQEIKTIFDKFHGHEAVPA